MQKRKSIQLNKPDKIIILICAIGIIFSLFGYFLDVYKTDLRIDEKPIAKLTERSKSVQRRFRDRLVWDIIRENTPLYVGDFVRTAAAAEAEITFDSGTIIHMSHDSLIEILPETDLANLKITSGTVSIKTPEKITLKAGNETLEISEDSIVSMNIQPDLLPKTDDAVTPIILTDDSFETETTSAISISNQISVSVEKGTVRQNKSDGSIVELSAGSQTLMDKDGKHFTQPAIIVTSPKPTQKIIKNDNESVSIQFTWKTLNYEKDTSTYIELSYDKDGVYPYQNKTVSTQEAVFDLPNRTLYWKAYPVSKDGTIYQESAANGTISVCSVVPVKKLQPVNNVGLTYKAAKTGMQFSWTADNFAKGYELQIADNAEMQNPNILFTTAKTEVKLDDLEAGTWYWQVVPLYNDSVQASTSLGEIYKFTVQKPVTLKSVTTYKPEDNFVAYTANGRQPILFNWAAEAGAVHYTLKIADNPRLKNPVAEIDCNQTYFSLNANQYNIQEGRNWYWAITFEDKDGNIAPLSDIKSFYPLSHSPYFKATKPEDNLVTTTDEINSVIFAIDTNLPIDSHFLVSKDDKFTEVVIDAKIKSEAFKFSSKLLPGFYYWKIVNGSYASDVRSFLIKSENQDENTQIEPPEMMLISKADFTIGNNAGTSYEKGEHNVQLSSYYISKSEVTQELFYGVTGKAFESEENLPMTNVSWFEAIDFCNRLSMLQGLTPAYTISGTNVIWNQKANGYRLLTEAEWEYAAKTKSKQEQIWSKETSEGKPHPEEGTSLENMLGNVSEWCWDWFGYYRKNAETNPIGANSGTERVIRGGNYNSPSQRVTVTFREGQKPNEKSPYTGFRIARNGE